MKFISMSNEDKACVLIYCDKRLSRKDLPGECCICYRKILRNELYYDGGMKRRAHDRCVKASLNF